MAKSAIVSGASKAANIWAKIFDALVAKGGTGDVLETLDTKGAEGVVDSIADLLYEAELKTRKRFPIEVNYHLSLKDAIEQGKYNDVNPDILSNFTKPSDGIFSRELILVYFHSSISSEGIVRELAKMGLEPARIEHALAFGKKFPTVQKRFPIMFLGSQYTDIRNRRAAICLSGHSMARELCLRYSDTDWGGGSHHFAAIRSVSTEVEASDPFPIVVDYGESLKEMIAKTGCEYRNVIPLDDFPFSGVGIKESELFLVHIRRNMTREEAVGVLRSSGLEPASIEHAFAFQQKYPSYDPRHLVLFLGSCYWLGDYRFVPRIPRSGVIDQVSFKDELQIESRWLLAAVRRPE